MTRYWRDITEYERKVDLAALDFTEEAALREHGLHLGTLLLDARDQYIVFVESPGFSRRSLRKFPLYNYEMIAQEFARVVTRSYADGRLAYEQMKARQASIEGREVKPREVSVPVQFLKDLAEEGREAGRDFANVVYARVAKILDGAFAPGGRELKTRQVIVAEIIAHFAEWIQADRADMAAPKTPAKPTRTKPRRMKIRDRAAYEKWQKQYLPFSKRMQGKGAGRLDPKKLNRYVQTLRNKQFNIGLIESAIADDDCVQLQFSAIRDEKTCEICLDRDGIVRPKNDDFWTHSTPPLHDHDRCNVYPIFKSEKQRVTPKKDLPDPSDIQIGFGGYDPRVLRMGAA